MQTAERTIVVDAHADVVFAHWTRLEEFPRFWTSLGEVRRLDETHFAVRGEQEGKSYEMVAEVTVRIPSKRIAWRTVSGPPSSGAVTFETDSGSKTRISLQVLFEADGGWQRPESVVARIESALAKFKEQIESLPRVGS